MSDHFNHDFDGGSPDIPLSVGDRFYGQDRSLDFQFVRNLAGQVIADLTKASKVYASGGVVTQGTGDTLDITPATAVVPFTVTLPDDFSIANPPTTLTQDVLARVASTQQTNMAIGSATLNGATVNYVKLAYAETLADSRARAKKAGSYDYKVTPSFVITVDATPPTARELTLATFTGVPAGSFVIDDYAALNDVRKVSDTTQREQTSPSVGTLYDLGMPSLTLSPGIWELEYSVLYRAARPWELIAGEVTLSTDGSTETDGEFTTYHEVDLGAAAGVMVWGVMMARRKILTLASTTTFTLLALASLSSFTYIRFQNNIGGPGVIQARRIG